MNLSENVDLVFFVVNENGDIKGNFDTKEEATNYAIQLMDNDNMIYAVEDGVF
jgi:dsDNA-binding SOS-regulon protein